MPKPVFDANEELKELFKEIESVPEKPNPVGSKEGDRTHRSEIRFNMKPEELESFLNKYVVGQEEAIGVISTKVCTHFNRMKLELSIPEDERIVGNIKSNILLIGPTGIGKTYIIKLIAKKLGVPFIKADATKFSETGYVGGDVEDLVRELVHEAEGDIARAEYGIIYLDEIDKIASGGNSNGPDVSRGGVQRNLLKLMEESEVDLKTPHDLASQVEAAMEAQRTGKVSRKKINTKNILFIVSGAFSNLDKIIKKRLDYKTIGFDGTENKKTDYSLTELFKTVTTQDLVDFGFESEFVGRLPVIVTLNEVDEDKLYKILQNPYSAVINSKKLDFKSYGIDVEFKDEALKFFAKEAAKQKTGARALMTVVERLLINYEKVLPSLEIKQLTVDDKLINDPEGVLSEIMRTDSIRGYQRDFLASHGIHLSFEDEAITVIEKKAKESKKSMKRICEDLFHDFPYAIKLMKLEEFRITVQAAESPQSFIEEYIRKSYQGK
ncbi:MAG TPA: AAA family ATPase [Spirochaetota bacterium]|jgi:endopeptidase Clp ATP-binding regulatory subunit ClpX|nr:AAA family ATPase [Spirochaetota bacterium]HPJ16105.1 AAA family ATPase [Spirochaetota bacterium]HQO21546.1 AAA family ATPase [Spirochaetota bacterium]HQQ22926.1 AAA family ATPase [Spirochaetota bacterium]